MEAGCAVQHQLERLRAHLGCGLQGRLGDVFPQHGVVAEKMQRRVIPRRPDHARPQVLRHRRAGGGLLDAGAHRLAGQQGEEEAMDLRGFRSAAEQVGLWRMR